jgi:hypothetical protein
MLGWWSGIFQVGFWSGYIKNIQLYNYWRYCSVKSMIRSVIVYFYLIKCVLIDCTWIVHMDCLHGLVGKKICFLFTLIA